jgi:hypothetical protein
MNKYLHNFLMGAMGAFSIGLMFYGLAVDNKILTTVGLLFPGIAAFAAVIVEAFLHTIQYMYEDEATYSRYNPYTGKRTDYNVKLYWHRRRKDDYQIVVEGGRYLPEVKVDKINKKLI